MESSLANSGSQTKPQFLILINGALPSLPPGYLFPNPYLAAPSLSWSHQRPFFILRMCSIHSFLSVASLPFLSFLLCFANTSLSFKNHSNITPTGTPILYFLIFVTLACFMNLCHPTIFILALSIWELLVYFSVSPQRLGRGEKLYLLSFSTYAAQTVPST